METGHGKTIANLLTIGGTTPGHYGTDGWEQYSFNLRDYTHLDHICLAFWVRTANNSHRSNNRIYVDDVMLQTTDNCALLGGDTDGDGICDDGDDSGTFGDNPCIGGVTEECDDNCFDTPNPNQDDFDVDGIGDFCDECTDIDGDGYGNPGFPSNTCPKDECPDEDSIGFDVDGDGCIDSPDGLYSIVETLVGEGTIAIEMKNSLLSKIVNSSRSVSEGKICPAANELKAMINQVNAQRGKKINDESADKVTSYAQSVVDLYIEQLPYMER